MIDSLLRRFGRELTERYPELEDSLMRARGSYEYVYVKYTRFSSSLRFDAPIAPLRIYEVDPDRVEFVADNFYLPKYRRAGLVVGGNWDRLHKRFEDTTVHRALEAHWTRNVEWQNTAYYQNRLDEVKRGLEPWGCSSPEALEDRLDKLDELYETIRDEGYRTQREIYQFGAGSDDPIDRGRMTLIQRILNDEVAIDIGRHGELLFSDGRHRLSIAKILSLESIPVLILARHRIWQEFRDRMARGEVSPETIAQQYSDHPDLSDVSPSDYRSNFIEILPERVS